MINTLNTATTKKKFFELSDSERDFLLPFAMKRLKEWSAQRIQDKGSKGRFERNYLQPLQKAIIKLQLAGTQKYAPMEKAILAGCIRENAEYINENKFPGAKTEKNPYINELLSKLDFRIKTKF